MFFLVRYFVIWLVVFFVFVNIMFKYGFRLDIILKSSLFLLCCLEGIKICLIFLVVIFFGLICVYFGFFIYFFKNGFSFFGIVVEKISI